MRSVGVGIVGLGGMGHLHARTVADLGATVVAGADVSPDSRAEFNTTFDARTYERYEDLVVDDEVEAVVVTTPNRFHEPIAVAALEAGRSVLVEKPLAHTIESARRIREAAMDAPGCTMVGFHNRHSASARLFDAQNERGRFGDIQHVEANYVRRRGVPGTGSWFTEEALAGGGALIDIGVHAIDLALSTMDFPDIVEVSGTTRSLFDDPDGYADPDDFGGTAPDGRASYDVDDSVSAFVRTADGRTISLEAAWASNREPSMDIHVRGSRAGAQFEIGETSCRILSAGTSGVDHYEDAVLSTDAAEPGYRIQDRHFLECVETGSDPTTNTVTEAFQVQRVIDAIYESAAHNRSVRLDSPEDGTVEPQQAAGVQFQR
ncbi:Gfo/Idh/MocA family protein [Halovivax cerinus]|uniref:Gfo/Idh/MocA family protein n=1 Tax=Halovivax cerinus TaxID=1487865 RepID=A0ABD5NML4_9EURY|nr:Gfo/Idh/MocA family oxidoreductase [Halovivax cerinus]